MQTKTKESIYLYNIKNKSYEKKLKLHLIRLGIRMKEVKPADYIQPLGVLVGNPPISPLNNILEEPFSEEMLLMVGFTSQRMDLLLSTLRKEGIRIPLKAVLTEHNINWSSIELYHELKQEHEKFQKLN